MRMPHPDIWRLWGVQIRLATEQDAAVVSSIMEEVYVGGGWADPQRSPNHVAELLDAHTRIAEATVLLAADDEPVGTITAAQAPSHLANIAVPGELEIRMLAVVPQARHRGIARALVAACEDLARNRNLTRMVLSTEASMTAAIDLYERLGYERTPDRDWDVNGFGLITYGRDLP
jgi:ribosomal protein S18 acetylase RimI-like enzyme